MRLLLYVVAGALLIASWCDPAAGYCPLASDPVPARTAKRTDATCAAREIAPADCFCDFDCDGVEDLAVDEDGDGTINRHERNEEAPCRWQLPADIDCDGTPEELAGVRLLICGDPGQSICLEDVIRQDFPCLWVALPGTPPLFWKHCGFGYHVDPCIVSGLASSLFFYVAGYDTDNREGDWSNQVVCETGPRMELMGWLPAPQTPGSAPCMAPLAASSAAPEPVSGLRRSDVRPSP